MKVNLTLLQELQDIGFSEKEARVYLVLVSVGAQPASVIAERVKINRTTTYDVLNVLIQKGLVSSVEKGSVTLFKCLDPKELLNYLEREKIEHFKALSRHQKQIEHFLPALISLQNPESNKPKVLFYEGEKGMRQAYEDTLTSSGDILAYANVEEMHKGLPNFFPEYYKRRGVQKKIHIKAIMPDNEFSIQRSKKDTDENRESVLIPRGEFDFSPEINIYDDKVLIASWREKMAIIIQSKEIADAHRTIYKLAWKEAKRHSK